METRALRVVFSTSLNRSLVQCPCCADGQHSCWCCDGNRWDYARDWEWGMTVAEQVRAWGGSEGAVDKVRHLTIEPPLWLDVATGERRAGVEVPKEDCICHEDALPCGGCGRIIPDSLPLCIFCVEAGRTSRWLMSDAFMSPDTEALLSKIAALEKEREADKARLENWITNCTRERIKVRALSHMLQQVLTKHAAFLDALREADQLLKAATPGDEPTP